MIRPMPSAVITTKPTDRAPIDRLFARKSITEVRIAAAYSNGGRKPSKINSGVSRGSSMNGTKEMPMPTSINSSGAENRIRSASAVTSSTVVTMAKMVSPISTPTCFHGVVTTGPVTDDGSRLLTSPTVAALLEAATEHAGGRLVSWRLDHVDTDPRRSTTATYAAVVDWPTGRREELLGASARAGGRRSGNDDRAVIFGDGDREVAVWLYPDDPDLPGLRRAASAESLDRPARASIRSLITNPGSIRCSWR